MPDTFYMKLRRNRLNIHTRELTANVLLSHKQFIQPLFVDELISDRTAIPSLSGVSSDSIHSVLRQIEDDINSGIVKFLIFPVPAKKSDRDFDYNFAIEAIRSIKAKFGQQIWVAVDVCLCSYTTHGHCGVADDTCTRLLNHQTVIQLADYALQLAKAGADCIAPSDMADGRVAAIRLVLNENGYDRLSILSYSAKFSSQFYSPFRDVCRSAPDKSTGLSDRKSYQISAANSNDAMLCALRDAEEGSDIIMVKPSVLYLDIIARLKHELPYSPIAAYHVSGEYQSIELLAQTSGTTRAALHLEAWISLKRAGADIIISYAARHAREWIHAMEM